MPSSIKDYFHFSKRERKGILALIFLISIVLLTKKYFVYVEPMIYPQHENLNLLQAKLDSLEQIKNAKISSQEAKVPLAPFNPNDLSKKDWQAFGLSKKQAQAILNYKEKAGGFKSKEQVKKLFVISDVLYNKIESKILLPETITKKLHSSEVENKQVKNVNLDREIRKETRFTAKVFINTADTSELKKLYGIGKILSQRIVSWREKLGGFYSKQQLNEIWGLKKELLLRLDSQLILDSISLRKLNINFATKEDLKNHPYLSWKHANAIVNYRKQHGHYKKLEELKNVILITDSLYQKVLPYLIR